MSKKIVVIGGGIAGMSAAHELIERGFEVEVYDRQPRYVGGKARSIDVPNSGVDGRKDLPGEHGFRFFPGFYKHITDTMKRIPFSGKRHGVFDNQAVSKRVMMARFNEAPLINIVNFPKSLKDIEVMFHALHHSNTGLTKEDTDTFAKKIWQLMTSSYARRNSEYERISWWEFTDAGQHSEAYRQYFVGGITRTLVAAKPKEVSTKTGGDILLQLLFLMGNPFAHPDRILNGPTNEAFLYPWWDYLVEKGVKYHHGHTCSTIACDDGQITGATFVDENGAHVAASGDYYISALPVEVMAKMLTPAMLEADPTLQYLPHLAEDTAWMNGIQYFLNQDVTMTRGHVMYTDSPWALTSISQLQFWKDFDISQYGNGEVKGVLSIDVSDWTTPGLNGKKANECTKEEILSEVWEQLKKSLIVDGKSMLSDDMLVTSYIDADIIIPGHGPSTNKEPLLVNKVNTWPLRPDAYTHIPNLFLASDYVRTFTDLATMEGANEAARRAVNAILEKSESKAKHCEIWHLHEPDLLSHWRKADQKRFEQGLPWKSPHFL